LGRRSVFENPGMRLESVCAETFRDVVPAKVFVPCEYTRASLPSPQICQDRLPLRKICGVVERALAKKARR